MTLDTVWGLLCVQATDKHPITHLQYPIPFLPVASDWSKFAIFLGVWKVSRRCLEGVWEVSKGCLRDSGYCQGGMV